MTQHLPRRRATRVLQCALLAAFAAPLVAPAQPANGNAALGNDSEPVYPPRASRAAARASANPMADTLAFAHTALRHSQIEMVPVLERMGTRSQDQTITQPLLLGVTAELRSARAGARVLHLLDRTASSLDAMCADAAGARRRSCRSMTIQLTAARAHLRAGRKVEARRALDSLAKLADESVTTKAFQPWEGMVIGETARYAIERV